MQRRRDGARAARRFRGATSLIRLASGQGTSSKTAFRRRQGSARRSTRALGRRDGSSSEQKFPHPGQGAERSTSGRGRAKLFSRDAWTLM